MGPNEGGSKLFYLLPLYTGLVSCCGIYTLNMLEMFIYCDVLRAKVADLPHNILSSMMEPTGNVILFEN